ETAARPGLGPEDRRLPLHEARPALLRAVDPLRRLRHAKLPAAAARRTAEVIHPAVESLAARVQVGVGRVHQPSLRFTGTSASSFIPWNHSLMSGSSRSVAAACRSS